MNLVGNSLLSVVTFLPAVVAIFMCFLNSEAKQNARWIALWTTLFTFALSLLIWINFDPNNPDFQFVEERAWLGPIKYKMGVDGISMLFVVLTAFLMPLCILASWESIEDRVMTSAPATPCWSPGPGRTSTVCTACPVTSWCSACRWK